MGSLRLIGSALIVSAALFACIEYKAEPENGKQACATPPPGSTSTKLCPDDYQCVCGRCYKDGSGPSSCGGSGGGGAGKSGSISTSGGLMCSNSDTHCPKTGSTLSVCCGTTQCKLVAGSNEYPCDGFDCQSATQLAYNYCNGVGTGGSGGSKGGTPASSSYRLGGSSKPLTSGGAGSKASSSSAITTTNTVTFRNGAAVGAMTGYGWIALGPMASVTNPTCGAEGRLITSAVPCTDVANWNSATSLCVSGVIPALPAVPTPDDQKNNWGIQIGVNAQVSPSGALGRSFSTISANVSGIPATVVSGTVARVFRILLHRQGDADSVNYCYGPTASGAVIPLNRFNTKCWGDDTTVYLQTPDVPKLDRLGIQINSGSETITISNMCLTSITFGP